MLEKYLIIFLIISLHLQSCFLGILEIENNSSQNFQFCNSRQCVESSRFCDGENDCIYGSVEELFLSDRQSNNATIMKKRQAGCLSEEAQCKNGECVQRILFCDGIIHCSDGSDETDTTCFNKIPCRNGFKCKYGACISKKKSCDGEIDCVDKSDESIEYADCRTDIISIPKIAPPTSTSNTKQKCTVPKIENLSLYLIKKDSYFDYLLPGTTIESSTETVYYSCSNGYKLREYNNVTDSLINYCIKGSWATPRHPSCTRLCSSEKISGVTFDARCNGNKNDCTQQEYHLPGTIAKLKCRPNYIQPSSYTNAIVCQDDGNWEYSPQRCEPDCGIVSNTLVEFINGGKETNILDVPWHAAIFYRETEENNYEYQCGGTIINPVSILSAAHCFWNRTLQGNERLKDYRKFKIVVGTTVRDYKNRSMHSQAFSLKEIIPYPSFEDIRHYYLADIALVKLNSPISFNNRATPICIDDSIDKEIETGVSGIIPGWGEIETNKNPTDLHSIELSTLSNNDCRREAVQNLAVDKFCLNSLNSTNITGSHVCYGDSGGGFVQLKKSTNIDQRYILRGVLSSGHNDVSCSSNNVAGFTDIYAFNYKEFIKENARKNNPI